MPVAPEQGSPTHAQWIQTLEKLTALIGLEPRERWFSEMRCKVLDDGSLALIVPNMIHQVWIEQNFLQPLAAAVSEVFGKNSAFRIEVQDCPPMEDAARAARPQTERLTIKRPSFQERLEQAGLTDRLSFASYAVGTSNRHSALAAKAVAQNPGSLYNPFFLSGPTSTGKTHLVQAIGQDILSQNPDATVHYLTAELFTNEFLEALHNGTVRAFRNRYRQVDALIIDDVQFFIGKESTSEEFFHTFNEIINARKQIIISSEVSPAQLKMDDRMRARFESGLTAHLTNPDMETRLAILRVKNAGLGNPVADSILHMLADRIRSNVRRLEGALIHLASHQSLSGATLDTETVTRTLSETFAQESASGITLAHIQKVVADHFDIRVQELLGSRRVKLLAAARHAAMYLCRTLTPSTLQQIGEAFGSRDHTTVMHAVKTVSSRLESDAEFAAELAGLKEKCKTPRG